MRPTIYPGWGRDCARVGAGCGGPEAPEATRDLLARFADGLGVHGLTLDNAVKTRLFARDRASRDNGSLARRDVFRERPAALAPG